MSKPLWTPSKERVDAAILTDFIAQVGKDWGVRVKDYDTLYDFSVREIEKFWESVWKYSGLIAERNGTKALSEGNRMPGAKFFPAARLNFAENMLRRRDETDAIVFWGEDKVKRRLSYRQLYDEVSKLAQALKNEGVEPGDRVVGFLPNMPETVIAMLATSALGAVWSSCSPDFGVQGVLDRFGQIEPKVLLTADGYYYNGKPNKSLPRVAQFMKELPSVAKVVVVAYLEDNADISGIENAVHYDAYVGRFEARDIAFHRGVFNRAQYIMYSSGTTGMPKCIVHGQGGTLIQHLKEQKLQCDIKPGDRVFYFTTCGWMMWNWLVSVLASEATLLLYDGSPFYPNGNILWDFAEAEGCTFFGTSAKYIDALGKAGVAPKQTHKLASLRTIASTGSPLVPEGFDYVYSKVKEDVCLSSIAGGTDIISCFVGADPIGPVWRGEIQKRHLAMAVEVFNEEGKSVVGEKGELVCTKPFPSMPIGFWQDPEHKRYKAAYFEKYPGIWCHGDYVELTEHGGIIIYGRSDATLNPGGVRIGTAEIYRQVEKLPEVLESLVIGQDWQGDARVVLFLRLREGEELTPELEKKIKSQIREGCTPRHVPAKVIQVKDIPRTKSGKIVELAVRDVVHGRVVKNKEALANPEALELYRDLPALAD